MTPADQQRFPPQICVLRDGTKGRIRPLLTTDGERLAAFYGQVPPEDELFYCPHPLTEEWATRNAAHAESPHEVVLVIETPDGGIGGYAWYRWQPEARESGFGICIARRFQGTGAGKQLMLRLLEIARTVGPPTMVLTVLKRNPKAKELYTKMGFRVVREQVRPIDGEPEYFMELAVRSL